MSIMKTLQQVDDRVKEWSAGKVGEELPSVIAEREAKKELQRQEALSITDKDWKKNWELEMAETVGIRNVNIPAPISSNELVETATNVTIGLRALDARILTQINQATTAELDAIAKFKEKQEREESEQRLKRVDGSKVVAKPKQEAPVFRQNETTARVQHQLGADFNEHPDKFPPQLRPAARINGLTTHVANLYVEMIEFEAKSPEASVTAARANASVSPGESIYGRATDIINTKITAASERGLLVFDAEKSIVNELTGWTVVREALDSKLKKAGMLTEKGPRPMNDLERADALDKLEQRIIEAEAKKMKGENSDQALTLTLATLGNLGRLIRTGQTLEDPSVIKDTLGTANLELLRIVRTQRPIDPKIEQTTTGSRTRGLI